MKFTKLGKRIAAFFAVIALGFAVIGCQPVQDTYTVEEAQNDVNSVLGNIVYDATYLNEVTKNFNVVEKNALYETVTIEWSSSEEDVIKFEKNANDQLQGLVTRPAADDARIAADTNYVAVTVTVAASATADDGQVATGKKEFVFKVLALEGEVVSGSIKDVKLSFLNHLVSNNILIDDAYKEATPAEITGTVYYAYSKGIYVNDGEDGIFVYGSELANECKVGDVVKISGTMTTNYGQPEIKDASISVVEGEATFPVYADASIYEYTNKLAAAETADGYIADAEAYAGFCGHTYKLYAQLIKEEVCPGDAYGLVDPYWNTKISIYHYSTDSAEQKAALDVLVGKYVEIEVTTVDRYSTNDMYRVLWTGSIVEAGEPVMTDEIKLNKSVQAVKYAEFAGMYYNGQEFAFPEVAVEEGVTVTWAMDPATALVDGKLVIAEDGTINAVATVACGELSEEVVIEINVSKEEKVATIAEYKAAADGTALTIVGKVVAKFGSNGKYAFVEDATGAILVYNTVNANVGDTVKIYAAKGSFNGTPQVTSTNYTDSVVETGEWVLAEATPATIAEICDYTAENAPFGAYLQVSGVLTKDSSGYFWLAASTAADAQKISLYSSNVPEDLAAFAGSETVVTLNIYFYGHQKSSWSDAEGARRVIFCGREGEYSYEGEAPTPTPTPEIIEATVAEFLAAAESADQWYKLTGTVTNLNNTTYGNFDLVDASGSVYVYGLTATKVSSNDKSFATLGIEEGDTVVLIGTRASFNGTAQVGGPAYYVSHTKPVLTEEQQAQKVLDKLNVPSSALSDFTLDEVEGLVWSVKSGTAITVDGVTATVTRPAAGSEDATVVLLATYTLNGTDYVKEFTVTVAAEVASGTSVQASFDFAANFATYAKSWSNSYASKTVTAADLGVSNVAGSVTFSNVSKQTGTITDKPVMASKNTNQYVTFTVEAGSIEEAKFEVQQWTDKKKFVTLTVEYTTDGSTWTAVSGVGQVNGTATIVATLGTTFATGALPAGVTGVRLVICGNSSSSNQQIGIAGLDVTVAE